MADVTHANSPALVGTTVNVTASHEGVNCVPFNFVAGGVTVSASTIIFLAKIPHGAHITALNMSGWIASAGNATVDVGLVGEASLDFLVDGAAISATGTAALTVRTGALPHFVSLSDDTQPRFRYLQAKLASVASAEVSCIIRGSIEYVMGRPSIGN
jgi:hypothetical protein